MAISLWNALGGMWRGKNDTPGLPTHVPPAPASLAGPLVVVVVTDPPPATPPQQPPASVVIEMGAAALRRPPVATPKLQRRATTDPVLPLHHTGEIQLQGSLIAGSAATHRAIRRLDAQRTPKEPSEEECLAKLQKLESDPPSGLRDADKAFYKIMLAKRAADPNQAKSTLLEARECLASAQKLTRENTLCPQQLRDSWTQKIQENQTLLSQVAAELSISLDPKPSPVPSAPAPVQPSRAPEKPSSSHSSITYMVVGIIVLLGVFLVTRGAIYGSRLWRKI